ncbi:MAG: TonB-dependent receptor [Bacteroidales bacterium]|nr:TonB-dependent receptor [Bacteroidales bacterium]
MKKRFAIFLSCLLFVGIQFAQAQTVRITGTITGSEDGMPLPGVSVVVKGTTIGAASDANGKYDLSGVPADAQTLVVSYLGYVTQEIGIGGRSEINVVMVSDSKQIDEVIVVAYGTSTKSSFTGSAGTVKTEQLQKRQVSNVSNALAGQVAGVQTTSSSGQPGTSATIRIRGIGSINASRDPLYVVDGVPFDGSISSLNPQDIETMTVLKDAAANALYGARGANGVILITTKKGKGKDARIVVDAKWGNSSRAVPNYDVMKDPALYYETFYKALYNGKVYNGSSSADAYAHADTALFNTDAGGLGYKVYTVPVGEKFIGTNFKLNPNATLGYSDGTYYYTPDDWYDELFNSSNLRQEYNVSISGTSDKINYYFSAGYLDEPGIVSGSGLKRYSGRSNVDYQAKKWLKIGANIGYTNYDQKAPTSQNTWGSSGNLFYITNNIAPIYPMYVRNADGSIKKDNRGITVYDFGNSTNFKRAFMALANPAITLKLDKYSRIYDELNSKWYAVFTPIDGLTLTTNIGANVLNRRTNYLYNQFYGGNVGSKGSVYVAHYRQMAITQQYMANYKRTFADIHNFEILAAYESYDLKMQQLDGTNNMLYSPFVGELNNAVGLDPDVNSYTNTYAVQGYLARIQYDYDGKYFASASYRRDASSRFHSDNRWGNFGSMALAWLINKEEFLKPITWVDMLKLKVSYGVQGNDDLGGGYYYYAYADQYEPSNSDGQFAITQVYKGNKDLTWETSHSTNIGVDFELFKSRLTGTVEYFNRKTKDLLYLQPTPNSAGFPGDEKPMNVGALENKGFEIDLNGVIFTNGKIEWSANLNATHYTNEITDLHPDVKENGIKGSSRILEVGGSIYDVYMRKFAGVSETTGKSLYYLDPDNGDYTLTDDYSKAKQARLGGTLPDVYGGFGTQVKAYGFDFSIQFSYQLGGRLYDGSYEALMHNGNAAGRNWHVDIKNAWTPENTKTDVPRLCNLDDSEQKQSSRFLVSSNYLSLNSIVLGYTVPENLVKKINISSLRVYVAGDNLGVLSKRRGLDPRQYFGGGSSTTTGNFSYSAMKTISAGVTLTF